MLVAADGPLILFTFQNKDSDMNDLLLSRQALFHINHEEARSQHQYFVLFHAECMWLKRHLYVRVKPNISWMLSSRLNFRVGGVAVALQVLLL